MKISISQIFPDPNQPRKTFNQESLNELKGSLDGLGLIQPITTRPTNDSKYMIVVGERRFRAAKQRGDEDIECIVREDIDDKKAREMQFAENAQQEDLPPLERGQSYIEHRQKHHMSRRELFEVTGITESIIQDYEDLYIKSSAALKSYIQSGDLDASTASEILSIKNETKQAQLADIAVREGLSRAFIRQAKPLIEMQPTRPIQSIVAQARYNIASEKTNHRELLNEYKRQQLEPLPTPEGKYKTITIDPPWPIEKILRDVRPNQFDVDYPTMTIDEITALPIPDLADEHGCHIYLWTTHKFLPTAFDVLEAWGAKYQCLLTWVKNVGMTPFSWMYSTEHCLFARIGDLDLLKMGKRLDFTGKVREHSRKPDEFYDRVREVSPDPRIDMFGREKHIGFEVWGNEPDRFKPSVIEAK